MKGKSNKTIPIALPQGLQLILITFLNLASGWQKTQRNSLNHIMITQAENPGLWKQCKKLNYVERACIDKSDLNPYQLFHMGKTKLYA